MGKPRSEAELLGCVGRQVPEQLRNPVLEKIVQRSPENAVVEVLWPDPFPNESFGRHPLKKLGSQVKPLLHEPKSV